MATSLRRRIGPNSFNQGPDPNAVAILLFRNAGHRVGVQGSMV
jgi:hypothetical protein